MKLPTEIVTRHKIRDAAICKRWALGMNTMEELAERFGISATRVYQILYRNRHLVKIDKEWEEVKQVSRIKQRIKKAGLSKKDVLDWEVLLDGKITPKRTELSGRVEGIGDRIVIIRPEPSTVSRLPADAVSS